MTNPPAGAKRPHPESEHAKRDTRDWRDVHLRSPRDAERSRKPSVERRDAPRERRQGGRDRRDRERRDDDRRDHRARREDGRREDGRKKSPPQPAVDSEKEEGEISPQPSPEPQASTPAPPPSISKPEVGPSAPSKPVPPVEPEPELELELATPPPVEDTLAARRARRQAIMARYTGVSTDTTPAASGSTTNAGPTTPLTPTAAELPAVSRAITPAISRAVSLAGGRDSASASPAPEGFALAKDGEEGGPQVIAATAAEQSAADYDPSMDRREDEQKRVRGEAQPMAVDIDLVEEEIEEEVEEEDDDDVDDMFAIAMGGEKKTRKIKKKTLKPAAPALITTNLDTAADSEGYYQIILGEQLDGGRYQVFSVLGKGMFANVVRARVLQGESGETGREVAIKITRNQESMVKAGQKEIQILNKLNQADPEDKKHIVRLERTFEHRGHLCLVFESLSMNLRDVVKRFGKDVGLNLRAVRAYAHQLFLALSHLRKLGVMHADIKPDNILVNEQKTVVKLCDLGSAADAAENEITPYLVSRFYRAPEIIMGVPYDPALDIWSIGCTLYELYTGKILFPGRSNNQMLLHMMELKGRFNTKMVKKAKFGDLYFDETGAFNSIEISRVTGASEIKHVHISHPARDLRSRLMPPISVKLKDDEMKLVLAFIDLIDKCLALDPARRITPKEALLHPFIRG